MINLVLSEEKKQKDNSDIFLISYILYISLCKICAARIRKINGLLRHNNNNNLIQIVLLSEIIIPRIYYNEGYAM